MSKAEKAMGGSPVNSVVGVSPAHYLRQMIWIAVRTLLMVSLAFIILYPVIYMLSMAFRTGADIYDPTVIWIPHELTMDNVKSAIEALDYWNSLKNTIYLAAISTVIQLFICSSVGYGFGRFNFRGKNLLMVILVFTIVVPAQLIALPTYFSFQSLDFFGVIRLITGSPSQINLLDKSYLFFVLAFFGQGIRSGLFIMIFKQFYQSMPIELEDAATVDGAGFMRTYFRIMLPNASTVTLISFLFSFVWYWNDYYVTNIYLNNFRSLSLVLSNIRLAFENSMGTAAFDPYYMVSIEQAGCLLLIVPLIILYLFTQKYFTESIERTGIVG